MGKPWEQIVTSYSKILCSRKEADNKTAKGADRAIIMQKGLGPPRGSNAIAGNIVTIKQLSNRKFEVLMNSSPQ